MPLKCSDINRSIRDAKPVFAYFGIARPPVAPMDRWAKGRVGHAMTFVVR